jgi:hypothetical protein
MLRLGRVDIWYAQPSGFTRSDGETDIDRSACTLCFDDYLSCMQHMAFGRPLLYSFTITHMQSIRLHHGPLYADQAAGPANFCTALLTLCLVAVADSDSDSDAGALSHPERVRPNE